MKQILILLILIMPFNMAFSQKSLCVDCQNPGWLSNLITYPQQTEVENLTVTGYINKTDVQFINELIAKHKLSRVDLGNAMSTDEYVTFNYRVEIRSEDGKELLGYKRVSKISMPKCETFTLNLSGYSLVDTLQINSRIVKKAYYNSGINKIVLGNNVETIEHDAFFLHAKTIQKPLVDSLPNSLTKISPGAFSHSNYETTNHTSLINPNIVFPDNLEYIGEKLGKTDYNGYTHTYWNLGQFIYNKRTIKLPQKLKVWTGVRYSKYSLLRLTKLQCDTLIAPNSLEGLYVEVNAKVAIFNSKTPPEILTNIFHVNKLYVPAESLSLYQQNFKYADIQEILPIMSVNEVSISAPSNTLMLENRCH